MQADRNTLCAVCLVAAAVLAAPALAGRLPPPPNSNSDASDGDSGVRWIRKTGPVAPVPCDAPSDTGPAAAAEPRPTTPSPVFSAVGDRREPPRARLATLQTFSTEPRVAPAPIPDTVSTAARAAALSPSILTLDEAERLALSRNPTLVQAAARIEAARGARLQAGLYPNPRIGYQGHEIGEAGSNGQHGLFVEQEIVTAGKRGLDRLVAGWDIQRAEHAYLAQRERLLDGVRAAWYEVLVAQHLVDFNEQLVEIGQQTLRTAEALRAQLDIFRVDVLQARIEADSAMLALSDARHRHQAAWRQLAALLATPDMQPATLSGDLLTGTLPNADVPPPTWDVALQRLLAESPELAAACAGAQRARCELARQKARRVPNVDIAAGVRHHDLADGTVADVQLGVPLPIFNRNQGNICKARSEWIAAEAEVQRIELALQDRLATTLRRYQDAESRVRQYAAEILPAAKATLELARAGYPKQEADYITLLTAQRTYRRVHLAYLESLREYRQRRAELAPVD